MSTNAFEKRGMNQIRKRINLLFGYTLIEILIILFIISIVTGVGLLSIGRNDNKRLQSFANELKQVISFAQEQAVLQPAMLGVMIEDDVFYFATYQSEKDQNKSTWVPLQDTILGKHPIPAGVEVSMRGQENLEDESSARVPRIIISTSGDMTPFTLYIGKRGEKPRYALIGDADGKISYQSLS